jgi:hypothetical protein
MKTLEVRVLLSQRAEGSCGGLFTVDRNPSGPGMFSVRLADDTGHASGYVGRQVRVGSALRTCELLPRSSKNFSGVAS